MKSNNLPESIKIILVASGKGGVGKSTVSFLIAKSLQKMGRKVGILDADIYGPSIPTILGALDLAPEAIDGVFQPVEKEGIKLNSIGFLVKEESALAWRGPMLTKAIDQLLFSTNWNGCEYLIVDMPPGTGDIHISFVQKAKIFGAIIVTTPDIVAEKDVVRAIDLYKKVNLPILGLIENMSFLKNGEEKISIFSGSSAEKICARYEIKLIAKLPIIPMLSANFELYDNKEFEINFEN